MSVMEDDNLDYYTVGNGYLDASSQNEAMDMTTLTAGLGFLESKIEEYKTISSIDLSASELTVKQQIAVNKKVVSVLTSVASTFRQKIMGMKGRG